MLTGKADWKRSKSLICCFSVVLGMDPKTVSMQGKLSPTDLYPQPLLYCFWTIKITLLNIHNHSHIKPVIPSPLRRRVKAKKSAWLVFIVPLAMWAAGGLGGPLVISNTKSWMLQMDLPSRLGLLGKQCYEGYGDKRLLGLGFETRCTRGNSCLVL